MDQKILSPEDLRIIEQNLQAGKDVQLSYQKSKNCLHIKQVEVNRIK